MDLRQLRYFVGIVQAGSLSRAADQLHVAQSAISHHLASLESEVGRQLVTRGPKGILLTESGGVLYRHAEAILRHVEFAKHDALSAQNVPSGRVSIGFPVALASILATELFVRMRSTYPQILLHLADGNSAMLRERLDNGRLDLALLLTGKPERGLAVEPLVYEELFYATADQDDSPIRIADAARHPLVVPGPGSGVQRDAREAFEKHGLPLELIGECDSLNTMRELVASGIGNSIMTWSALHSGDQRLAVNYRRFADARMVRPVSLCFSEVGLRSPAIETVALTLKSLVRELVESGAWQGVTLIAPDTAPSGSPARNGDSKPDIAGRPRRFKPAAYRKMKNSNGHRKGRD
ncbi:MAG TPA: LysR substrate-binding domain-containing protein [Xanthobacteraceae bacterium]|nr:LysR substrate-binding domain-containing protein [Xanthobacteraceae bacterium]